jgi:hypothetical protein
VDLGIGGGACELDTPLRLGEEVTVLLDTVGDFRLRGEVAWVGWAEASAVRLGLRFFDQSADDLALLLTTLGLASDVGA